MNYYLRHPEHGTKVACLDMEVEHDLQNGWEIYDPCFSTESVEIKAAPMNNLEPKRRRKTPSPSVV